MNNKKATKRALLTSVMALAMCVVMLIGTTFAWFTDTATANVNQIKSGTLKVDIVNERNESVKGQTLHFVNNSDSNDILWEPGVTFRTEGFKIKNIGDLALKYMISVNNGTTGTNTNGVNLLDVIDFTLVEKDAAGNFVPLTNNEGNLIARDTSDVLYLQGHMQETANNDYQGLTLNDIAITVLATQDTVEYDSESHLYDKDATYAASIAAQYGVDGIKMPAGVEIKGNGREWNNNPEFTITLKDEEAFVYFTQVFDREAARAAREAALEADSSLRLVGESIHNEYNIWHYGHYKVKLDCDVDLHNATVEPFALGGAIFYFDGNGHTIKNANVVSDEKVVGFFGSCSVENVTLENIKVTATNPNGLSEQWVGIVTGYTTSKIDKVTVKNSTVTGGKYTGAIAGNAYGNITNCTVEDCTVTGRYKIGGVAGFVGGEDSARTITNNTLTNVTLATGECWGSYTTHYVGKIVGHWSVWVAGGNCSGNTFTGTGATDNIDYVTDGCPDFTKD